MTHHGLVDQVYSYPSEATRDKKEEGSSSLTNAAAWRFELIPDATNAAAIYCTERQLRTFYALTTGYAFPCAGFFVKGGTVMIQTTSFEVPELWCSGGTIASGQGHTSAYPVRLIAPKMHFIGESQTVTISSVAQTIVDTYIFQATPTADAASSRPLRSRTPPAPSSRRTLIIR